MPSLEYSPCLTDWGQSCDELHPTALDQAQSRSLHCPRSLTLCRGRRGYICNCLISGRNVASSSSRRRRASRLSCCRNMMRQQPIDASRAQAYQLARICLRLNVFNADQVCTSSLSAYGILQDPGNRLTRNLTGLTESSSRYRLPRWFLNQTFCDIIGLT